jgi:hypothetical protein
MPQQKLDVGSAVSSRPNLSALKKAKNITRVTGNCNPIFGVHVEPVVPDFTSLDTADMKNIHSPTG